jgi:crotonobetainyl-CoA:carnitine CoA-transferase CaiB-like acyl-CoA transferase
LLSSCTHAVRRHRPGIQTVLAEDLVATLDHPAVGRYRTMTKPIKFSDTPGPAPLASPTFGEHSDEILAAHGYSAAVIASLRERGIVR